MYHSNQVREFLLTDTGVELCDVYSGPATNLTGAARLTMISETKAEEVLQQENIELKNFELETKRNILDSKILALRAEFSAQEAAALTAISQEKSRNSRALVDQTAMRKIRKIEINNKSSKVGKGSK
jgi:circadian clock protein KaiC